MSWLGVGHGFQLPGAEDHPSVPNGMLRKCLSKHSPLSGSSPISEPTPLESREGDKNNLKGIEHFKKELKKSETHLSGVVLEPKGDQLIEP